MTNATGQVVSCQRAVLVRQKCWDCTSANVSAGVDCTCEKICIPGGAFQIGGVASVYCTNTITKCVNAGITLLPPWKFVSVNTGGQHCYTKTTVSHFPSICMFPGLNPCPP